jgi:hypothetical protein
VAPVPSHGVKDVLQPHLHRNAWNQGSEAGF